MTQTVIKLDQTARVKRDEPSPASKTLPKHTVVVADKNPVVQAGLRDFLKDDERYDVVSIVSDGASFIKACAETSVAIGIVGWALPDMTGGDLLSLVKQQKLPTRVIIYTGDNSPVVLRKTVKAGAWGFVYKGDDPSVLLDTVASVARGRLSLPFVDIDALTHDPLESLTARERELLTVLAKGWTNDQIASRIGISRNTVKYHLKNLYEKLDVRNRAMAVALYMSSVIDDR